jgi:hypothetical protein
VGKGVAGVVVVRGLLYIGGVMNCGRFAVHVRVCLGCGRHAGEGRSGPVRGAVVRRQAERAKRLTGVGRSRDNVTVLGDEAGRDKAGGRRAGARVGRWL